MAFVDLEINVPLEIQVAQDSYTEFRVRDGGRNLIYTFQSDVFYMPLGHGLDGTPVATQDLTNGASRMQLGSGTGSMRLNGSGYGKGSVKGQSQSQPQASQETRFAIAGAGGTAVVNLLIAVENVSS